MNQDTFQIVRVVLADALELPPTERMAFVESACGANETARTRVLELLAEQDRLERTTNVLSEEHIAARRRRLDHAIDNPEIPPERIGRYRIVRRIGVGGMGVVYEAEQMSPRRRVALKVVDGLRTGPDLERRLEAEAEIQGTLQHAGIAQVFDAGVDLVAGARRPYFVMEYIEGRVITAYADDAGLDLTGRLELLASVADAMGYAHSRGVIHRDLKPENILVKSNGQPKVLDFGIARVTGEGEHAAVTLTRDGHIMGTLAFMAPEQVAGAKDITAAADVYALGVIAFELITGKPLLELGGMSLSSAIREVGNRRPPRLREVHPSAPREVETIVGKALAHEPESRYDDGVALAADIRRYLASRPILARPPSRAYRTRKFVQRHRTMVVATALCALLLIGGLAGTSLGLVQAQQQRARATARADDAEKAEKLANERSEQLQRVASLQTQQLRSIDPPEMGRQLRASILASAPPLQRDIFGAALAGVNFTTIAIRSLERNYFRDLVKTIDDQFADQPLLHAELLQSAATTLSTLGILNMVEDPQARARAIRERELGPDHADTIASARAYAVFLVADRRFEEAETQWDRVLEWNEHNLAPDDRLAMEDIAYGATITYLQDDFEGALAGYMHAYELAYGSLGASDPKTLGYLRAAVDRLHHDLHRDDEAAVWGEKLVASSRAHLAAVRDQYGSDSVETVWALEELAGNLWAARGNRDEVAEAFAEALALARPLLGEDHDITQIIIPRLAGIYSALGRFDEAIPLSLEHLDYCRRTFGDDHPDTLYRIVHSANEFENAGRLSEAEPLLREAYLGRLRVFGPGNDLTLYSFGKFEANLTAQGKTDRLEQLYLDALAFRSGLLGEDDPLTREAAEALRVLRSERALPAGGG